MRMQISNEYIRTMLGGAYSKWFAEAFRERIPLYFDVLQEPWLRKYGVDLKKVVREMKYLHELD